MSSRVSSIPTSAVRNPAKLVAAFAIIAATPLHAQDDTAKTDGEAEELAQPEAPPEPASEEPVRIDLTVTVPRGDVNESNVRACEDEADAASISGDIIVCRRLGEDNSNYFSGSRDAARKRVAEETAFADAPRTPEAFGIPNHGNPIGFGSVPPPALIIDVKALPEAPEGSDADRIARGLPPLGDELSEEEEKARREALGLGLPTGGVSAPE